MRALLLPVLLLGLSGVAAAEVASVMPPVCTQREALDPAEYQRLGRFLSLGGGYRQWVDKNCYPSRLDDAALSQIDRPIGYVASVGSRDVFIVDLGPTWWQRCTQLTAPVTGAVPVTGSVPVDGATQASLHQHLAMLPETASLDLREIGFAEARMRDKRVLFALYLATGDKVADLACFDNLDNAVIRASEELSKPAAR